MHDSSEFDFAHLMECRDTSCWYCNDQPEPRSEVENFLEAMARGDFQQTQLAA